MLIYRILKLVILKGGKMEWFSMAVFLYVGTLTHCVSDFLSSYLKGWGRKGLVLHCFLYTLLFIPLFWWLEINLWWLILILLLHYVIDANRIFVDRVVKKMYSNASENRAINLGLDQILHLLTLLIIALLAL